MNNTNTVQSVQSVTLPSLPPTGFSRLPAVREFAGGAAASTIWLWVRQKKIPQPVKLSPRVSVWRNEDLHRWAADPLAWQAANRGA